MAEARNYDFDPVSVERMLRWHLGRRREYFQLQPADREDLLASAMELFLRNYPGYDPAKSKLITWTEYIVRSALYRRRIGQNTVKRGLGRKSVSLDEHSDTHEGSPATFRQMITASHESASVNRLAITEQLGRLSSRERQVIELRYFGDQTLSEVGKSLGVSRQRVRQLEARALGTLRAHLTDEKGREDTVGSGRKSQHVSHRVPLDSQEELILGLVSKRTALKDLATALGSTLAHARHLRSLLLDKIGCSNYVGAARYLEKVHQKPLPEPAPTQSVSEQIKKPKRVVHQKAKGPVDPAIGKKIREIRLARGMTQATLAGEDFSKGFISLVENGRTRISLRAGEIFAARLGVPLSILLPGGSGKNSVLPNGLDGQVQEVLTLLKQGSEFSRSAFTTMLEMSKDYTRIKAGVGKIQKMLTEAPEPDFSPDDVASWMRSYITWLRTIKAALEVTPEMKETIKV